MNLDVGKYLCTSCGEHLMFASVAHQEDGSVCEGELVCHACSVRYPVVGGIPRFVSVENYAGSFGYQWNMHSKTQLDSYTGLPISHNRLFTVTGWSKQLKGERILEAGSGAGRFTEVLLQTGADVFSFDYSNAVDANWKNNGHMHNLHLFQGDIFNIPLPQASFDKVICLGVLQHTPDPEKAFMSLAKFVKPGGELIIDVYRADVVSYLHWKYVLCPLTKRMGKERLYRIVSAITPLLVPLAAALRRIAGRIGVRFVPIVEYSHLNLPPEVNNEWAILDTFDMYSPAHDHPQKITTVSSWFNSAGFTDVDVRRGPNGIVGKGKKN